MPENRIRHFGQIHKMTTYSLQSLHNSRSSKIYVQMFVQLFTPSKIAYFGGFCIRLNALRAVLRYYSEIDMDSYSLNEYRALEAVSEPYSDILDFFLYLKFSYRKKFSTIYRKVLDRKIHKIFT